jgi:hypothetical protein
VGRWDTPDKSRAARTGGKTRARSWSVGTMVAVVVIVVGDDDDDDGGSEE